MRGGGGNFFQNVVALDELAERGVLAVEKARIAMADEKLGAGGIGIIRARHREDAANVGLVVEFRLDLVAGAAGAPQILFGIVFRVGVAPLNHEILDDAMKAGAVVKALPGELLEIFDVAGRNIRPEFDNHFACAGVKNGNFAHKFWG